MKKTEKTFKITIEKDHFFVEDLRYIRKSKRNVCFGDIIDGVPMGVSSSCFIAKDKHDAIDFITKSINDYLKNKLY